MFVDYAGTTRAVINTLPGEVITAQLFVLAASNYTYAEAPGRRARPTRFSRTARLFRVLVKVDLLLLDDWGPDRLSASPRRDLMEVGEDRHGRGSMLITSLPFGDRGSGKARPATRQPGFASFPNTTTYERRRPPFTRGSCSGFPFVVLSLALTPNQ